MAQHHVQVLVSRETFFNNIQTLRRLVAPSKLCVVRRMPMDMGWRRWPRWPFRRAPTCWAFAPTGSGDGSPDGAEDSLAPPWNGAGGGVGGSVRELDIQEQVGSRETDEYLSAAGARRGRPVDVHLDIDTGMGRSGFFPEQRDAIRQSMSLPGLRIAGLMSHFPTADSIELAQTCAQIERMERLLR